MKYVKIKVLEKGTSEDLLLWKDHMLEEPKCWNRFCFGCNENEDIHAFYVQKEGDEKIAYITSLCEDCINSGGNLDILVNENHLIVETHRKE